MDYLRKGNPVWRRDNHLVARIDQGHEHIEDRMLAADGGDHFLRSPLYAKVLAITAQDRILELRHSANRRIPREVLVDGASCRLLDIIRRIEIGLARAEIHHIHPLGFEFLRRDHHLHGGGFFQTAQPLR